MDVIGIKKLMIFFILILILIFFKSNLLLFFIIVDVAETQALLYQGIESPGIEADRIFSIVLSRSFHLKVILINTIHFYFIF